jgi:DNA-binding transcriptional ArsR family regulator
VDARSPAASSNARLSGPRSPRLGSGPFSSRSRGDDATPRLYGSRALARTVATGTLMAARGSESGCAGRLTGHWVSANLRLVAAYRPRGGRALAALGDPTRRAIFERLVVRPRSVRELADVLPVSRPAVSQHLKVLKQSRLVTIRPDGTRRIYRVDPAGVAAMREYLNRMWDTALAAFAIAVEDQDSRPTKGQQR